MKIRTLAVLGIVAALTACSFQNKDEKLAQKMTEAVIANDMSSVKNDIAPGLDKKISRVQVAQYSDELNRQGKIQSLKENDTNCDPGYHCFDVQFEKSKYREQMLLDEKGQIAFWHFHAAEAATSTPTP